VLVQRNRQYCRQRKRLGVAGELAFRQPITTAQLLIKSLKLLQMSNRISSSPNWCKIVLQKLRIIPSSPNNAKPYVARSFCLKESNRKIFWYYFPGYVILYSCLFCLLVLVLAYLYLLLSILNIVEI
jgi:hypothetical protein